MLIINQRLISKLLSNRNIDSQTKCWNWTSYKDKDGYGRFGIAYYAKRIVTSPHRAIAYLCLNFNLKSSLIVMHKCDNPACFNPLHLKIGTQEDNIRDCGNKGKLANQYGSGYHFNSNRDWSKRRRVLEAYDLDD